MPMKGLPVFSPMVRGSGAAVVHSRLAAGIPGYRLSTYSPRWEYLPFAMPYIFGNTGADIVHTSPDHAVFFRQRCARLVITFHGFALDDFMRPYSSMMQRMHYATDLRWFTRLALARADVVTAVSRFVADKVTSELGYRGSIEVIPNGVDTGHFTPAPFVARDELRVLFSGNLSRHKGADVLVEVAKRVPDGVSFAYTQGLRARGSLPALPQLEALGSVPHEKMADCYRQSDILLAPSVREGFGLAVAEAMASGLPVVASRGSALPELVVEGEGGYLCEPGDAGAFAEKIEELRSDPALRRRMGLFNRERVERLFNLPKMLAAYRDLFDRVHSGR